MPADFRIHFGAAILEFERHFHAQTASSQYCREPAGKPEIPRGLAQAQ